MRKEYLDSLKQAELSAERVKEHRVKIAGGAKGVMDRGARHTRMEVTGAQVEEARAEMKGEKMEKQLNLKKFTDEMFKAQADGDYGRVRMLALTIADKMAEKPNTFYEKTTVGDFTIEVKLDKGVIIEFSRGGENDRFKLPLKSGEDGKELAKSIFNSAIWAANDIIGELGNKGVSPDFSAMKIRLAKMMQTLAYRK